MENLLKTLEAETRKAEEKHPVFPEDPEKGIAIIAEEFLELVRSVNDGEGKERQKEEAFHTAVTLLRFILAREKAKIKHWEIPMEENGK